MSGTTGAEILAGGPPDEEPGRTGLRGRPPWVVPTLAAVAGLLLGVAGTRALAPAGPAADRAAATSSSAPGAVEPEVLDGQVLAGTGGLQVVAPTVPGASTPGPLRYDYSLVGAVWLAPDGTVRSGPPDCTRTAAEPEQQQFVQVAVVHARPVDGGPSGDRVVWYRCAPVTPSGAP